jgi:hypothetical protein
MPFDHLRLGRPIRIDALERIEDEIDVIAPRTEAGDDRVEHAEIHGGHKDQLVVLAACPIRGAAKAARLAAPASMLGIMER